MGGGKEGEVIVSGVDEESIFVLLGKYIHYFRLLENYTYKD